MTKLIMLLSSLFIALAAFAEQKIAYKEYDVHYMVLTTAELNEEVAKAYNITRSGKRAMINISLLDTRNDDIGTPTQAKISGYYQNTLGQRVNLEFREINEGYGIYYIDEFGIDNKEFLNFVLEVQPSDRPEITPFTVKFQQQTWTQ